jgi:hypothetical protein
MARYSGNNDLAGTKQALSTSYKTLLTITAATATLTRAMLLDLTIGTNGTPADNVMEYDISRVTALGTGTSGTLNPNDGTIRAAGSVLTLNHTAEPTVTATSSLLYIGMNQRATYRWVADPGGGFVIPATNLAGLAIRSKSAAYTGTASATAHIEE